MRIHNLTDVPTPVLQNAGLVNVPIKTSGVIVQPGAHADVARLSSDAERFIKLNALFIGADAPKAYKEAKAKLKKVERKTLNVQTQVNVSDSASASPAPAPAPEPEPAPAQEPREPRRGGRSRE